MARTSTPPSRDGSVVLDIGGDVGALLLRVPPDMDGQEIDLVPEDPREPHTHSAVRERHLGSVVTFAAVYPSLKAGTYTVGDSTQRVHISGGRVTETDVQVN